MPSFDVVSEIDKHEVNNAIDQANREIGTRFDFKGTDAKFVLEEDKITLHGESEFHLQQMLQVLNNKMAKRGINLKHLKVGEPVIQHKKAEQIITLQEGLSTEVAKKIVKLIKENKFKVQAAIQGEQIRVTGKKRDDLQEVIAFLKKQDFELPLQFGNFRD